MLHEVRDFLGHTRVSQTDTYLGTNADRLHEALKRFEAHRNGGKEPGGPGNDAEKKPDPQDDRNSTISIN